MDEIVDWLKWGVLLMLSAPLSLSAENEWVTGKTQVNNCDVVHYQEQCVDGQCAEKPDVGDTIAWGAGQTQVQNGDVVSCSGGRTPPPFTCLDGSIVASEDLCSPLQVECPTDIVANIYVSPLGKDSNLGTQDSPYLSLKKAATKAKAGDVIQLMPGKYSTAQVISNLHGTEQSPITIHADGAKFDGTVTIRTPWVVHSGNIYKTQVSQDIWQLFVGDKMVMSARWPNAQWDDGSLWDMKSTWRHQAPSSQFGVMVDERPYKEVIVQSLGNQYVPLAPGVNTLSLANSGIDVTGAIAIMNIGSWLNWAQLVSKHSAGSDSFRYSKDFSSSGSAMKNAAKNMLENNAFWQHKNVKYEEGHYFLEGKLSLLDSENEWFFDKQTKTVYLWAPEGKNPNDLVVRGKQQTYGLTIRNSSHLLINDPTFFATAFQVVSSDNIVFDGVHATYYAYSKRMLGQLTRPETIKFINNDPRITRTQNVIRNSYLAYTDGPAFDMIKERGNRVDNNLIHDIDYSNLGTGGEGALNMSLQSEQIDFTNNTFHTAGNSEGVRVGATSRVVGNHIYNVSLLQHDGAAINVGVEQQAGTEIAYNWVHDTNKAGIRFDGVEGVSKVGERGQVHHNVVWNSQFSIIKGEYQATYNNVMFDNDVVDLIIFNNTSAGGLNTQSETFNNIVGTLQGRKSGTESQLVVPGLVRANRADEQVVFESIRGPLWGDFRLKPSSNLVDAGKMTSELVTLSYIGSAPDLGAYELGEAVWHPGYRGEQASNPVPFDASTHVDTQLALRFNIEENAQYRVLFGESPQQLSELASNAGQYIVSQLKPETAYFWRVDRVKNGTAELGTVWRFTTK